MWNAAEPCDWCGFQSVKGNCSFFVTRSGLTIWNSAQNLAITAKR